MKFEHSKHWKKKRKYRPNITDDLIEYTITTSEMIRDKYWPDVYNALANIHGRKLKVVYKREKDKFKIITAFWVR